MADIVEEVWGLEVIEMEGELPGQDFHRRLGGDQLVPDEWKGDGTEVEQQRN